MPLHIAGGDGFDFARIRAKKECAGFIKAEGLAMPASAGGGEDNALAKGEAAGCPSFAGFGEGAVESFLEGVQGRDEDIGPAKGVASGQSEGGGEGAQFRRKVPSLLRDINTKPDHREG